MNLTEAKQLLQTPKFSDPRHIEARDYVIEYTTFEHIIDALMEKNYEILMDVLRDKELIG